VRFGQPGLPVRYRQRMFLLLATDSSEFLRLLFFFFQAEDGIRDKLVTGVQTCALPISSSTTRRSRSTLMRSLNDWRRSWAPQCVVARRPSSRPARAKSNEPVHTDVTLRALAATRRIQARVSSSWIRARVPKPPGTTSRSMDG